MSASIYVVNHHYMSSITTRSGRTEDMRCMGEAQTWVDVTFRVTVALAEPGMAISSPTFVSSLEKPPWLLSAVPVVYVTPAADVND